MKVFGWIMIVLGVLTMGGSWLLPTTVHQDSVVTLGGDYRPASEIINIGLLQNQMMVLHTGMTLFLAGMIGMCVAELRDAMIRAGTAKPEIV